MMMEENKQVVAQDARDEKRIPGLKKFAYFLEFDKVLERIAAMAQPEAWAFGQNGNGRFPLLDRYLCNVFDRLKYETEELGFADRFITDSDENPSKCIFNTGLLSRRGNYIYLIFDKNKNPKQEWFFRDGVSDDPSAQSFLPFGGRLPKPADFYLSLTRSGMIYAKDVKAVNADHILLAHCERLPMGFLKHYFRKFFEGGQTLRTADDWQRFKKYIAESGYEFSDAQNKLRHCIELAQKKAMRGDAFRVHIYRPETHGVAFFMPLYLENPKDDCDFEVGVIVNNTPGGYVVSTIYHTSMAYDKIRVMGEQKRPWLDPARIKYWKDPTKNNPTSPATPTPNTPMPHTSLTGLSIKENFVDEDGTLGGVGDFYPVEGTRVIVGRKSSSGTADIRIQSNRYMSRSHVVIEKRLDGYYLEWIGSTNPPVVNGKEMVKDASVRLKNGDILLLGQCKAEWVEKIVDAEGSLML